MFFQVIEGRKFPSFHIYMRYCLDLKQDRIPVSHFCRTNLVDVVHYLKEILLL